MRNMLATLLLSQGTPMLLAGDEFGRTQQGNNNAYCQDNEISWMNWDVSDERRDAEPLRAEADVACATSIRSCGASGFSPASSTRHSAIKDVTWINASGAEMRAEDWAGRQHALLRHADRRPGAADRHRPARRGRDAADRLQRLSRPGAVHAAGSTRAARDGRC